MKTIIYHTPIITETIAKNGSEKFGANAKCKYWYQEDSPIKIEIAMQGKTIQEAEDKLIKFFESDGRFERKVIEI